MTRAPSAMIRLHESFRVREISAQSGPFDPPLARSRKNPCDLARLFVHRQKISARGKASLFCRSETTSREPSIWICETGAWRLKGAFRWRASSAGVHGVARATQLASRPDGSERTLEKDPTCLIYLLTSAGAAAAAATATAAAAAAAAAATDTTTAAVAAAAIATTTVAATATTTAAATTDTTTAAATIATTTAAATIATTTAAGAIAAGPAPRPRPVADQSTLPPTSWTTSPPPASRHSPSIRCADHPTSESLATRARRPAPRARASGPRVHLASKIPSDDPASQLRLFSRLLTRPIPSRPLPARRSRRSAAAWT